MSSVGPWYYSFNFVGVRFANLSDGGDDYCMASMKSNTPMQNVR